VKNPLNKLTKLHKSETLKHSRFSRANLVIFAIIFACVGGYLIFSSFAAGPTCSQTFSSTDSTTSIVNAIGSAANGSAVCLNSGNYSAMTFAAARSGYVTIQPVGSAQVTIASINFGNSAAYYKLSYLTVSSEIDVGQSSTTATTNHITMEDSDLRGGVVLFGGSSDVMIDHNLFDGNGGVQFAGGTYPIAGGCCNLGVNHPFIQRVTINGNKFNGHYGEDAIQLQGFKDVSITNNEITGIYPYCPQAVIDNKVNPDTSQCAHADGVQTVWGGSNLTITGNYIHDNNIQPLFVGKDGDVTGTLDIEDNLIVRDRLVGYPDNPAISPGEVSTQVLQPHNAIIRHNTWAGDGTSFNLVSALTAYGGGNPAPAVAVNNAIDHNVFSSFIPYDYDNSSDRAGVFLNSSALVENYNIMDDANNSWTWVPDHLGSCSQVNNSPTFVNTTVDDYRLASNVNKCGGYQAGIDWKPADIQFGPRPITAADFYMSPTGSGTACTQASPCKSMDAAYHAASLGNTVQMAAGTYPANQTLTADASKVGPDSTTPDSAHDVTFKPAPGASVIIDGFTHHTYTTNDTGSLNVGSTGTGGTVAHVTIQDVTFNGYVEIDSVRDFHLKRTTHYGKIFSMLLSYVSFEDGEITFPNGSEEAHAIEMHDPNGNESAFDGSNILIKGMKIHNIHMYTPRNPSENGPPHPDGIHTFGRYDNVSITGNNFWNNECINIRTSPTWSTTLIENNVFGPTYGQVPETDCGYVAQASGNNLTYRYNSQGGLFQADATTSNSTFEGNVGLALWDGTCNYKGSAITEHNNYCPDTLTQIKYVNATSAASNDMHLQAGSPAIGAGNPSSYPATDIEGNIRSNPPDAGAYEYTGPITPPPPPPNPTPPGNIDIGENTITSTDDSGNANLLLAQQASLSQSASLQSLSFYVTNASGKLRLGIYDATGPTGGPGTKLAETAEITPTVGWNTTTTTTHPTLAAGSYWLAYLPNDNNLAFKKSTNSSVNSVLYNFTYNTMPNTFPTVCNVPSSSCSTPSHWSLFATLNTSSQPKQGDINQDNSVNITDLSLLLSSYGQTTTNCITNNTYVCDIKNDTPPSTVGHIDIFDLSLLLSGYGS
jgi:hypothetical protein